MNESKNKSKEYQVQDEQAADYVEPADAQLMRQQIVKSKLKRLLIPVFFIFAIYTMYSILSWVSKSKSQAAVKRQEVVQQQAAIKPVTEAPINTVSVEQPITNVNEQLVAVGQAVKQQMSDFSVQLNNNQEQIAKIGEKIVQSQADIVNLQKAVSDDMVAIKKISDDLQKFIASQKKPKAKPKIQKPAVSYHVKAVVPGRAWLESETGSTVSIRVGDRLEGYGVIEFISPKQGVVVTSLGYIIEYGNNDI